jgi:hypothetical protein
MEYEVMKKKLDTYRKPKGQFRRVNSDLLVELLRMWELHTGPSSKFARQLGIKSKQLGRLVQQASTTTVGSLNRVYSTGFLRVNGQHQLDVYVSN